MAINKNTKSIKLIMSHFKETLKKDGVPVTSIALGPTDYSQYLEFHVRFRKALSKDYINKLKSRTKEFSVMLTKEHSWLECDDIPEITDSGEDAYIDCEINLPTYNSVTV